MIDALYGNNGNSNTGIRYIQAPDLPKVWNNPSLLNFGTLNLLSINNPIGTLPKNPLMWGQVSKWTSATQIIWGSTIKNPKGQQIIWGSSNTAQGDQIIWGSVLVAVNPQ
jgi:hypothetical protein